MLYIIKGNSNYIVNGFSIICLQRINNRYKASVNLLFLDIKYLTNKRKTRRHMRINILFMFEKYDDC